MVFFLRFKDKIMKICIPTQEDKGLDSSVYGHFGSAPYFMICNTENNEIKAISNMNEHHEHGACNPLAALNGEMVAAIIVGGIGKRAILGLNSMGIKVYQSIDGLVKDNVKAFKEGKLSEVDSENACAGHSHGHSCGH